MFKKIIAILILPFSLLLANIDEDASAEKQEIVEPQLIMFHYINFESIYHIPSFLGYGYRIQKNKNGIDGSFSTSPYKLAENKVFVHSLNTSYLRYINNKNTIYLGFGLSSHGITKSLQDGRYLVSPSVSLGKQFNKSFMQAKVCYPSMVIKRTDNKNDKTFEGFFPVVTFSYGLGF